MLGLMKDNPEACFLHFPEFHRNTLVVAERYTRREHTWISSLLFPASFPHCLTGFLTCQMNDLQSNLFFKLYFLGDKN